MKPRRSTSSTTPLLMPVVDAPGLFADAMLADEGGNLLFLSLWGRDTAIQEFRARLSLPVREGGLEHARLEQPDGACLTARTGDPQRLESDSGRTSSQTIFGTLVHLWLFDRLAREPDRSNRRAMLIHRNDAAAQAGQRHLHQHRLWEQVRASCHLPLLPHWRKVVIEAFRKAGWIRRLEGHAVSAWVIDLGDDAVEALVTRLIREGRLSATD